MQRCCSGGYFLAKKNNKRKGKKVAECSCNQTIFQAFPERLVCPDRDHHCCCSPPAILGVRPGPLTARISPPNSLVEDGTMPLNWAQLVRYGP